MNSIYSKDIMILPSVCDASGKLSFSGCASLFMDIATEHAEKLGIGLNALGKDKKFWLTVKTRIDFIDSPAITEQVTLSTWPEKPEKFRCNRDYSITSGGKTLAVGKTQWAVINYLTNKIENIEKIYPEGLEITDYVSIDEPFRRIGAEFGKQPFAEYTVRSTDIDVGRHMNNAAYFKAAEGAFGAEEWKKRGISSCEVHFLKPCFEGNRLKFYKNETENMIYIKIDAENYTAAYVILCKRR